MSAPTITVLYFAAVRDLAGTSSEELALPESVRTVAELRAALEELRPLLRGRLDAVRFARNEEFCAISDPVVAGDVIAIIPPVAGG